MVDLAGRFSNIQILSWSKPDCTSMALVLGFDIFLYSIYSTTVRVAVCLSFQPGFSANKWPLSIEFVTILETARLDIPKQLAIHVLLSPLAHRAIIWQRYSSILLRIRHHNYTVNRT